MNFFLFPYCYRAIFCQNVRMLLNSLANLLIRALSFVRPGKYQMSHPCLQANFQCYSLTDGKL